MIAEEASDGAYRVLLEGWRAPWHSGYPRTTRTSLCRRRRRPPIFDDRAVTGRVGDGRDKRRVLARRPENAEKPYGASPVAPMTALVVRIASRVARLTNGS